MKIKRKTLNTIKKAATISFFSIVMCGFLYAYGFTGMFLITNFSFSGVEEKDADQLTQALRETVTKKTFFIIPGDKMLTFNIRNIKDAVDAVLPNTSLIRVFPIGMHTLRVSVTPHVPLFSADSGEAYDINGVRYREQNDISSLPSISITSTTTPEPVFFKNLSELVPHVGELLFPVSRILVDDYGDIYLYASGSESRVIMNSKSDFNRAWLALVSAIDTDPLKSTLAEKKQSLEYIDLRFGNKVFYKFASDEKTAIIPAHATTTLATSTIQ